MLLFLSIAFLFIAPLLNIISSKKDFFYFSLNGFAFVVIAALVGLEIIPELIEIGGLWVFLIMAFGFSLPAITEKIIHNSQLVHKIAICIAVFALAIHTLSDGMTLAMEQNGHHLALSVALHRIPIGLIVWWFIKPDFGKVIAYGMLAIIALGTLLGFYYSDLLVEPTQTIEVAYFQAFVVGTLVHVLFHRHHDEQDCHDTKNKNQKAEGIGNLVGLFSVFYLMHGADGHGHHAPWLHEVTDTIVYLALETAPMLLLAFLFAGVIKAFMPDSFVSWLSKGGTFVQANKGMAVGVPLPLCSCSVVPVYHTLIKKGVPKSAAIAFLIATPEIGIDALLISLPLLGADMTVARLICAALLAVIVALVVSNFSSKKAYEATETENQAPSRPLSVRFAEGMRYSTHDLLDHIAPWIIVGIIVAALIHPFIGDLQLARIPSELQVILFAALGIPVYVCASSATPLVAIFLISGVSPGAGLAFLLSGPATNVSTFGILAKLHDKRTAILLAASCLSTSIVLGLVVNQVFSDFKPIDLLAEQHEFGILHWGSLVGLLALFSYSIYRKGLRSFIRELKPHRHNHGSAHKHSEQHECCSHDH